MTRLFQVYNTNKYFPPGARLCELGANPRQRIATEPYVLGVLTHTRRTSQNLASHGGIIFMQGDGKAVPLHPKHSQLKMLGNGVKQMSKHSTGFIPQCGLILENQKRLSSIDAFC